MVRVGEILLAFFVAHGKHPHTTIDQFRCSFHYATKFHRVCLLGGIFTGATIWEEERIHMTSFERTGWRDEELSRWHRRLGVNCPAVDVDFLLVEYDHGKASALIEYKNEYASPQYASHPNYQALIDLGDRADLPVIVCRYKTDFSQWKVIPLNDKAKSIIPQRTTLNEIEYISLLYKIRGRECPKSVIDGMKIEI